MADGSADQYAAMDAAAEADDSFDQSTVDGSDAVGTDTLETAADTGEASEDQPEEVEDPERTDTDVDAVEDAPDGVAADSATDEQQYLPYSYSVGSESIPVQGVFQAKDGSLYVSPEAQESVNQAFHQARFVEPLKRENTTLRRQNAEKDTRFSEEVARATKTNAFYANLVEQGPEAVLKFLSDYDAAKATLKAEQEKAIAKQYYEQGQKLRATPPEVQQQKDTADVEATIKSVVRQHMQNPAFKDALTQDDWESFGDFLEGNRSQMFRRATDQDRLSNPALQAGQLVYNQDYVNSQLQFFTKLLGSRGQKAQSVAKAQAFNAKRQGGTPATPATQRARPTQTAVRPKRSIGEEWDEFRNEMLTPSKGAAAPTRMASA